MSEPDGAGSPGPTSSPHAPDAAPGQRSCLGNLGRWPQDARRREAVPRSLMTQILKTITPVNGGIYVERPLATPAEAEAALARARTAQAEWRRVPVSERARLLSAAVDAFVAS